MTLAPWHRALAQALVGERLNLGVQERPDASALVAELAEAGFGRPRIEVIAHNSSVWPFPLSADDRAGLGAAQFFAALGEARRGLDLESLEVRPPSLRTELNSDERRLMADVPPHWGRR